MDFQQAEGILHENGYKFYYNKMLSGRLYTDPKGEETYLSESEVISLAEELTNRG